MDKTPVTVLGLGRMGAALARAFVAAGHPTTVFNRTPKDLPGATVAVTAHAAVSASPLVIVCVRDHDAVRAIVPVDALAGRTLVNLTTGTPEQARASAALAAEHGADHLAGAIMAVPQQIGDPSAELLYDGPDATFDAHRATLDALGRSLHVGARTGMAALHDLALLGVMWASLAGYLHALALMTSEGVAAADFVPLAQAWLTETNEYLPWLAEQVDAGEYATDVSSLDVNASGLAQLVAASREQGVGDLVPEPLRALYARGVEQGRGEHSLATLVEVIRG